MSRKEPPVEGKIGEGCKIPVRVKIRLAGIAWGECFAGKAGLQGGELQERVDRTRGMEDEGPIDAL